MESYCDMYHHARQTWHSSTAEREYVPYIRPQDHGNHFGVKVLKIGRLCFEGNFECNVSRYTIAQLHAANHTNELEADGNVHLRIDYKVSGVGSAAVGPALAEAYRLNETEIHFSFVIKPQ
jgi:beta-galactosidase